MGRIFVITGLLQNMIPLSQNIIIYHEHGPQPDIGMSRRLHKTHNKYRSNFIILTFPLNDISWNLKHLTSDNKMLLVFILYPYLLCIICAKFLP